MFDYTILIGRFQPVHDGHVRLIRHALNTSNKLIIGIGSSNAGRSPRNPFSFQERVTLIQAEFSYGKVQGDFELLERIRFVPIDDMLYNDVEWASQVRHRINSVIRNNGDEPESVRLALSGYEKDATSYYLRFFPEWEQNFVDFIEPYHSTDIREFFYQEKFNRGGKYILPDSIYGNTIGLSQNSGLFQNPELQGVLFGLADEWKFNKGYDPKRYPVNVVTVDNVVTCNGHVLLVRRKFKPGQGMLALPGGHLMEGKTLKESAVKELYEETNISVGPRAISAAIKGYQNFDHPQRSERCRVLSTAFRVELENFDKLPKVVAGDDAEEALWVPLGEIKKSEMFEDHFDIIKAMT